MQTTSFSIYILYVILFISNIFSKARNTKQNTKYKKEKKTTQKKQQIFKIKLRKDIFRMFGPHSKSISAVSA